MTQPQPPRWEKEGIEPPESLKQGGWAAGVKPPFQYFDWFFNRVYKCLNWLFNHANDKENPHEVTAEQLALGNVQNFGVATQAEAEAGTATNKYLTPQRGKQLFDKNLTPLQEAFNQHTAQYPQDLAKKLDNLPSLIAGTDLNVLKKDCRARGFNFINGAVSGNAISIIEVKEYSQDWVIQKQHVIASNGVVVTYERAFFNGTTWSAWRDVDTKVNALTQSVNQLTAVPTTYDLALPSGFTSGIIKYRKGANNLVELIISLNKSSAFTNAALQIGLLPLGYYPINTQTGHIYFLDASGNVTSARAEIVVTAEGKISITGVGDMTNARQIFNFSTLFYAKEGA